MPTKLLLGTGTVLLAYLCSVWSGVTWYQLKTAGVAFHELLTLPNEDIDKSIKGYNFLMSGKYNESAREHQGDTDMITEHVRAYYRVSQILLSIADIEKMYIPPQIDAKQGLYGNQLLWEKMIADSLMDPIRARPVGSNSTLLDLGCGRGRVAHNIAGLTGGKVAGYNIDESQIENAKEYAKETGMEHRLDFRVADHHKPLPYGDNVFDGAYSFEALHGFLRKAELDLSSSEMFRVLKPGATYSGGEYTLTPHFDWTNKQHTDLYTRFMPTLAASQGNYPQDITDSLERAGFKILLSAPSVAPAWPVTDQKTDLFIFMRSIIICLAKIGLIPEWFELIINQMLYGGMAWAEAEKMKIADLNWRIIAEKPLTAGQKQQVR